MNIQDFTSFASKNIGQLVVCKKNKPISRVDITCDYLHQFSSTYKGEIFKINGFVCSQYEQSIMLEDSEGGDDVISFSDFQEYFDELKEPLPIINQKPPVQAMSIRRVLPEYCAVSSIKP